MNSHAPNPEPPIPGLSAPQCDAVLRVLEQFDVIGAAVLYGSRALGKHREESDIDLVLFGAIDAKTLTTIYRRLDDLLLPWEIDLAVYSDIQNQALRDHIDRVGIEIYRNDGVTMNGAGSLTCRPCGPCLTGQRTRDPK